MHITVSRVHAGFLQEGGRNVENLKFATGSWGVGRDEGILRPTQDRVDSNFLRGYIRDRSVLGDVAKISDVWLDGQTLAQVFGSGLQNSVVAALARSGNEPQKHGRADPHKSLEPEVHPFT